MSESCVALGELIKARLLIDYNIKSSVKIVYGCSVAELKTTTCSTVVLLVSRDAAYKPPRDTTSRPTRRRRGGGKPVVVSTVPGGRLRRWRRRGGEGGGERVRPGSSASPFFAITRFSTAMSCPTMQPRTDLRLRSPVRRGR